MKKMVLITFWICTASVAFADNYRILQMNMAVVRIGNKFCQKGSEFSDRDSVFWSKSGQAIKAQNVRTKRIYLFAEPAFRKKEVKTIRNYFVKTNRLSTADIGLARDLENADNLSDEQYLLDTVKINCPKNLDVKDNYVIVYRHQGKDECFSVQVEHDSIIIPRTLFTQRDSYDIDVSIYCERRRLFGKKRIFVGSLRLSFLPLWIE